MRSLLDLNLSIESSERNLQEIWPLYFFSIRSGSTWTNIGLSEPHKECLMDCLWMMDGGVGWWPVCHWSFNPTNGAFSPTGPSLQRADGELMGCELIKSNPASSHQSSCIIICWQLPPNPYLAHQCRLWQVGLFDFGSGSGRVWPKSSGFGFGFRVWV